MADEILTSARDYYASDPNDEEDGSKSAKLRFLVQRLLYRVERLEGRDAAFDIQGSAAELFDSVTGNDFESKDRTRHEASSALMLKIESDVHMLMDQLEEGFSRGFR